MSFGTWVWIVLFALTVLDILICALYARVRRAHDRNKANQEKNETNTRFQPDVQSKTSWVKRSVRRLDDLTYGLCRYTSIWIGHIPSHTIRRFLFRFVFCMRIDPHAIIHGGCEVRSPWNIKIGNSVIGVGAILDGRNGIEIEDDVVLATGVWIWTEQHDSEDPYFRCLDKGGKVTIKRHVWIGNRVSILPKVTIEEGCVIAAGAVVSKSCEPFNMYGGIPAKIIHARNQDLRYSNVTEGIWSLY